eukprot:1981272-Pleurochrysis_carterae.AAC.2
MYEVIGGLDACGRMKKSLHEGCYGLQRDEAAIEQQAAEARVWLERPHAPFQTPSAARSLEQRARAPATEAAHARLLPRSGARVGPRKRTERKARVLNGGVQGRTAA